MLQSTEKTTDEWGVDDMVVERAAKMQSDGMKQQRDRAQAILGMPSQSNIM